MTITFSQLAAFPQVDVWMEDPYVYCVAYKMGQNATLNNKKIGWLLTLHGG